MCGIIGMISSRLVATDILEALSRLEYRGYDSAGIACVYDGRIHRRRAKGKLNALRGIMNSDPLAGNTGIGHTRWATHGAPNEVNAHPHASKSVAVVHNGIIENYASLKHMLEARGYVFNSQTDTEVVPYLVQSFLDDGFAPRDAVAHSLAQLEGAFALGIILADYPDVLYAARRGSPLAIGYGKHEMYLGSDAFSLAPFTQKISYLEEGDWAELTADAVQVFDIHNHPVERAIKATALSGASVGKGNFRHFMQKEIFEQPAVIGETLNSFYHHASGVMALPDLPFSLTEITRIQIVACGTSYYAGLVARYWLERTANIAVDIDIASEFRYRNPVLSAGTLCIAISQSGETADTLAAMRYAAQQGLKTLAIVNVAESSIALAADAVVLTQAGPEIGVASTKAFTTQLTVLACITLALAHARQSISTEENRKLAQSLAEVPSRIGEVLHHDEAIQALAQQLMHARDMLYIGRGTSFAIAHEAALKMKEISYIHAEAYAAGEMKHGPIALIDEHVPVIAICPHDDWFEKTASNVQEASARGGKIVVISDQKGLAQLEEVTSFGLPMPTIHPFVAPILYSIPIQLLAYHVAVLKGTDVDQPRNLAKSVTVE